MKPLETLGKVRTCDGHELMLYRRDEDYQIRINGYELMTSRAHGSEDALAELAARAVQDLKAPRVLIGGLGMGFTLRAALDHFPRAATIEIAEVFPEVIAWNRGPLAHLASRPLEDRRVRLHEGDVADLLSRVSYDAILLDVDNGPAALTLESNAWLYEAHGIELLRKSLGRAGVLAIWSAADEKHFENRLVDAGLQVRREHVRARGRRGGPRHTIYLARPGRASHARRGPGRRR